jgi:hypothetical protein
VKSSAREGRVVAGRRKPTEAGKWRRVALQFTHKSDRIGVGLAICLCAEATHASAWGRTNVSTAAAGEYVGAVRHGASKRSIASRCGTDLSLPEGDASYRVNRRVASSVHRGRRAPFRRGCARRRGARCATRSNRTPSEPPQHRAQRQPRPPDDCRDGRRRIAWSGHAPSAVHWTDATAAVLSHRHGERRDLPETVGVLVSCCHLMNSLFGSRRSNSNLPEKIHSGRYNEQTKGDTALLRIDQLLKRSPESRSRQGNK